MKNKKLLYILIPCTLLLWGVILYKIFAVASGDDNTVQFIPKMETTNSGAETLADTFSIKANYRDPFLGKTNKIASTNRSERATEKRVEAPRPIVSKSIPASTPFPQIIYGGLIKNNQSNKQLVLVQINGRSTIMKIGDIENEVEIIRVFKDSIEVKYQKEKRFIKK